MSERVELDESKSRSREFGRSPAHLDIDFTAPRAALVEEVIAACEPDCEVAEIAGWALPLRTLALLEVTLRSAPAEVVLSASCPIPACGRRMDLPVDLRGFTGVRVEETIDCELDAQTRVSLRLPTGWDLRAAQGLAGAEATLEARRSFAQRLVVAVNGERAAEDWQLPAEGLAAIESALSEADPLSAGELETRCPECGSWVEVSFDLEQQLLALLQGARERLYDEVHLLAASYHWSEQEILAMPRARREAYLARLTSEGWA